MRMPSIVKAPPSLRPTLAHVISASLPIHKRASGESG
jgi:hypothetical protein